MNEENITIVLNALADKIRMLEWEKKCLEQRIAELSLPHENSKQY